MASPGAPSRISNKIIVKGIPLNLSPDKIIIHFQKKKNVGGGDVESVTFPKSFREKDSAIVEFSEAETVWSVLKHQHMVGGKRVTVSEYKPEQVFTQTKCGISPFVLEKLRNENREFEIYEVQDSTGVTIRRNGDEFEVSGEWYQMQAAHEQIERMISKDGERQQRHESQNKNDHIPETTSSRQKSPGRDGNEMETNNATAQLTSIIYDKDVFSYMNLVHLKELSEIRKRFGVKFDVNEVGESTKVTLIPTSDYSKVDAAAEFCNKLYENVSSTSKQSTFDLNEVKGVTDDIVEQVLREVKPEFPNVWISRMHDPKEYLLFIADTEEKCGMACNQFKYILQLRVPGHNNNRNEDVDVSQYFDVDMFGFIQGMHGDQLKALKDKYRVRLAVKATGDAVLVDFQAVDQTSDREGAKKALANLYEKISQSATQLPLKLIDKSPSDLQLMDEVIEAIKPNCRDVFISRSEPSKCIMFIADDVSDLEKAVTYFNATLAQKEREANQFANF